MSIEMRSIKSETSEQIVEIILGGVYPTTTNGLVPTFDIVDSDSPLWGSHSIYEESKTLLNRNFTDVYTNLKVPTNPTVFNMVHYNPEFGIIGFTDGQGDLWVYNRME